MKRGTGLIVVAALGLALLATPACGYGLDRWVRGKRWHYEITMSGAQAAGFSKDTAHLVAWANDGLDVYIQHPTRNVNNFMLTLHHWPAAHFDDVTSPNPVADVWMRYFYGTFYGLLWAADRGDYLAAVTILGTSAHAFQDFFSHSTWVNERSRKDATPFDFSERWLRRLPSHGKDPFSLWTASSMFKTPKDKSNHGGADTIDKLKGKCTTRYLKPMKNRKDLGPGEKFAYSRVGVNYKYVPYTGINLDRNCSTRLAMSNRRFNYSTDAKTLFALSRRKATQATTELLRRLGKAMEQAGRGKFWKKLQRFQPTRKMVKECSKGRNWARLNPFSSSNRASFKGTRPKNGRRWLGSHFDKHNKYGPRHAPWGFLTGGTYLDRGGTTRPGWHLRLQIATSDGTDGDVLVSASSGRIEHLLDRKDWDDFERKDNAAYYVGPFTPFTSLKIRLKNKGKKARWTAKSVVVHAYYIGNPPAYGRILLAKNLTLNNSSRTYPVKLPRPFGFDMSAFGAGEPRKRG